MIIKWIVCEVEDEKKQAFSAAQEKWLEIKGAKGFLAQVGGWDLENQNVACIIAFWESRADLYSFMSNLHDKIFHGNNQVETYKSIQISHFYDRIEMRGSGESLLEAARLSKLLRIADCEAKPDRIAHFEKVQKEIWLPGMKDSNGMLGGVFSQDINQNNHYLVSTFWDTQENHSDYVKFKLPVFQKKADIKSDLLDITGRKVRLMDSWSIIK
ncbi:MAG: YdbC family protein [Bacteroidales bacterium]|nr:YdbC family protein [Bacteroidales bacterium]